MNDVLLKIMDAAGQPGNESQVGAAAYYLPQRPVNRRSVDVVSSSLEQIEKTYSTLMEVLEEVKKKMDKG